MFAKIWPLPCLFMVALTGTIAPADEPVLHPAPPPPAGFPKFQWQEIDTGLKIGYAVILEDVNGDKKPDLVVVDQFQIVWYENPTWKKRVILDGKTKPDNVSVCAMDVDGDGLPELVVGAAWKPFDTKTPGTLQWLKRGKSLDEEWTMHPIACDEPTVHRIKAGVLREGQKPVLIVAPLMGREATKDKNWMDGRPVRILAYAIPSDPMKPEAWKPEVLVDNLHVVHNITLTPAKQGQVLTTASYEGVRDYFPYLEKKGQFTQVGEGNQSNPNANRGSSEIAIGARKNAFVYHATVEPWHGNEFVVYYEKWQNEKRDWMRVVLDDHLVWGHAVKFADLANDGQDMLIAGVRDNPTAQGKFTEKRGVRLYRNTDGLGEKWDRYILEDGGVAVEDLAVGDLNGDGQPDIVAVGRATKNCRIYWNQGR